MSIENNRSRENEQRQQEVIKPSNERQQQLANKEYKNTLTETHLSLEKLGLDIQVDKLEEKERGKLAAQFLGSQPKSSLSPLQTMAEAYKNPNKSLKDVLKDTQASSAARGYNMNQFALEQFAV